MISFGEHDRVIADWIHHEYGRKAGLLRHEYNLIFDQRMTADVEVKAGATVLIATPYVPIHPQFRTILRHIFDTFNLRDFIRSKSLIRKEDAINWYGVKFTGLLIEPQKKVKVNDFTQKWITSLELTDKKTKRSVRVEVQGSAFDAQKEALKLLYGDRIS
jgi:hypothetical protein